MASGLGNLLTCGGVLLAASVANALISPQDSSGPAPDASTAQKLFDEAYTEISNKKTTIVLAPRFRDAYTALRTELLRRGLILHLPKQEDNGNGVEGGGGAGATLDLSPLIQDCTTFAAERELQKALISAGLVLSPGEANGFSKPGYFRICCAHLTESEVEEVGQRLTRVMRSFKPSDSSILKKRGVDDSTNSAADDASPKKRSRAHK